MHDRIDALHQIESACWGELEHAARERDHEWHVLTLATIDGERADARSVVLRDVIADRRRLIFYTDSRSPKVAQMAVRPQATLLAWSRTLSWQLRLRVSLSVEDSGLEVSSRWARLKLSPAAQDYLSALPPGTPVEHFAPERASREHFAMVSAEVSEFDWLELHADGHRRARFDGREPRWLQP